MMTTNARLDEVKNTLSNVQASLQNLENQVGQLTKTSSKRPQESLHSNSNANPWKQLKAITLRCSRAVKVWPNTRLHVRKKRMW